MKRKYLGEADFIAELVKFLGVQGAASLLGKAAVLALYGVKTRGDVPRAPIFSMATRYRFLADVRAFHEHLEAAGFDWDRTDAVAERVRPLVRLMEVYA